MVSESGRDAKVVCGPVAREQNISITAKAPERALPYRVVGAGEAKKSLNAARR
jgi:hypothetical protein